MRLWPSICAAAIAAVAATGAFGGSVGMATDTLEPGTCTNDEKAAATQAPGLVRPATGVRVLKPLLCGNFAGGSRTMVISFARPTKCFPRMTGWQVFRYTGGAPAWKNLGGQNTVAAKLTAEGRNFRETWSTIMLPDQRSCSSGSGQKMSRLWVWHPEQNKFSGSVPKPVP